MLNPAEYIGKICKCLDKYYDARAGKLRVKSRPVLIIGLEDTYDSPYKVDFEVVPISKLDNTRPDLNFDILLNENVINLVGLDYPSYIRSHKTTWSNIKHIKIDEVVGDLKSVLPEIYNTTLNLNYEWVSRRTKSNLLSHSFE